jgi:hypothetical protein
MQRREASAASSRVPVAHSGESTKPGKQSHASKLITMRQATHIMEAVAFARLIGLPLVAHLTIHWSLTDAGDDPNGKLFAKVREGLDKWLERRGVMFAGAWAREPLRTKAVSLCGGLDVRESYVAMQDLLPIA